jgi:hypothetical protein
MVGAAPPEFGEPPSKDTPNGPCLSWLAPHARPRARGDVQSPSQWSLGGLEVVDEVV